MNPTGGILAWCAADLDSLAVEIDFPILNLPSMPLPCALLVSTNRPPLY